MKQDFPVLSGCTYLDTASSGILTQSLVDWRRAHDQEFLLQGSAFRCGQQDFLDGVRSTVARFFGASHENTILVPNYSFGFNSVITMLSPVHRVLVLKDDYPSLLNPLKTAGFPVKELEVDRDLPSKLYAAIREFKPTVFAFSLVQYVSGLRLDAELVKSIKKDFPDLLLLADGTQCCGTESMNFEHSGLDMLGASGYKWMLAGYGNGFVLLSDQLMSVLQAEHLKMVMEPGHLDTLNFGSLQESIKYLEAFGMEVVQKNVRELSGAAHVAFSDMGLLKGAAGEYAFYSQIFNLKISRSMHRRLLAEKIACMERGDGIRVGFHFYNDRDDLERLLNVLKT